MQFFTAIAFMAGLTITLAGLLVLANRKLYVWEDPRIDEVTELLPGANCGACGLPGCRAFAERVVDGKIQPSDCPVGGPDSARFIANYLGIEAGQFEKKVARLHCAGGCDVAVQIAEYEGYPSCRAAAAVTGGFKGCAYGCLGLADCEDVCDFDAIAMGATSLPVVDAEKCTACGDCVEICPKGLFEMMPVSRHLIVQCKSLLAGDAATALCKVACTGCGICAADAPEGLIEIKNGLAIVNPEKWQLQTDIATFRCPTGAIVWVPEQQFAYTSKNVFEKSTVYV